MFALFVQSAHFNATVNVNGEVLLVKTSELIHLINYLKL